jgi:hypothetical protein
MLTGKGGTMDKYRARGIQWEPRSILWAGRDPTTTADNQLTSVLIQRSANILPLIVKFGLAGRSVAVFTEALGTQASSWPRRNARKRTFGECRGNGGSIRV